MKSKILICALKVWSQPYPSRPIQLIIPNVAGAIVDINVRALSEELGKILGTQIIPINKPGKMAISVVKKIGLAK